MTKNQRARANVRCVAIASERDGQSVNMRVQTIEGHNVSAETISALLGIGAAAMKMFGAEPDETPVSALPPARKRAKRKAGS